ncbi:cannabinoid receptor 1-like [Dendronephthya gigantea]|uniref:cannabinoid receptor 1-like n=1 Tax=Dendronephthya gigantea TaxID=151771 RepID=UPI00106AAE20|nr:cannabinoid receptor 1-like [Dendronephthya gigantea]XP_028401503.1 cannabinoid receptor 1-like [Dendronephthya gigantea]
MVLSNGTIGQRINSTSGDFKCDIPFNLSQDFTSFDTASFISRVTIAGVLGILILPTIFMNIIILVAIFKNRNFWRSSHILIGFLAVTDAIVGTFSMPLFLSTILIELFYGKSAFYKKAYCMLSEAALNCGDLGMGWSFITITTITFERYVAIFAPFWYRKYVRTSGVVKATLFSWLIWAVAVVFLIVKTSLEFALGVSILILVVVVYFLAVPAFIRIFRLLKKIESSRIPEAESRPRVDHKGSMTCAIMLFCLIFCYTPLLVVTAVILVRGVSEMLLTYLLPWARLMLLANSFCNPIIYMYRNQLIRNSVKATFRRFFKKASSPPTVGTAGPSVPAMDCGISNRAVVINQNSKL